jgi:hypothetical protein
MYSSTSEINTQLIKRHQEFLRTHGLSTCHRVPRVEAAEHILECIQLMRGTLCHGFTIRMTSLHVSDWNTEYALFTFICLIIQALSFAVLVAHELVMMVAFALDVLSILMNVAEESATAGVNCVTLDVGEMMSQDG